MMTRSIGRQVLRLASVLVLAGVTVSCASSQQQGAMVAPAGYGKDPVSRAERLVSYCDRLAEKGELVTALGLCARAHEINPDDPETLMKVAGILISMNRQEAAVQTYGALLERHPGHHEAHYSLGKLYMETGESDLASLQFNHAMRSDPKDPRPYNALGILRDQAGEHEAAQALYRTALTQDPKNFSVRNNLGLSLALVGKRDEAIEVLAELAVDPAAGQTVLRNLEAAYASRPVPQQDLNSVLPQTPMADPAQPVTSEPLDAPRGMPAAMSAPPPSTIAPTQASPPTPAKGAPTPLFVPPATTAGEQQQSGARIAPQPAQPSSVILAAAERLMQPPEWADFEPGTLIGAESPPAAPQETPPQNGAVSGPGDYDLSMLFIGHATSNA